MAETHRSIAGKFIGLFETRAKEQELNSKHIIEAHQTFSAKPKSVNILTELREKHKAEKLQERLRLLRRFILDD